MVLDHCLHGYCDSCCQLFTAFLFWYYGGENDRKSQENDVLRCVDLNIIFKKNWTSELYLTCFHTITAMLRNETGWFDEEENSADNLSMRLANDATFVRAAFSNRLSIFIQDSAAVIVAFLIGVLLHWRLALVALATLPVLCVSALAQVCTCFSDFAM